MRDRELKKTCKKAGIEVPDPDKVPQTKRELILGMFNKITNAFLDYKAQDNIDRALVDCKF